MEDNREHVLSEVVDRQGHSEQGYRPYSSSKSRDSLNSQVETESKTKSNERLPSLEFDESFDGSFDSVFLFISWSFASIDVLSHPDDQRCTFFVSLLHLSLSELLLVFREHEVDDC